MNIRAWAAFAFSVISPMYFSPAAIAENCKPLTLLATLDMVPVKNDTVVLVKAKLDGSDEVMLLDTGGVFSMITDKTAAALGLETRQTGVQFVGVSGNITNIAAHARSFWLGRLHATNIDFMIMKDDGEGKSRIDGIIAPNLLTGYDVELDFTTHKVNLLSADHCEGKVIYWPATAIAVVPVRLTKSGHIFAKVKLDGTELNALIDTGSSKTSMSLPIAESDFGLKMGSPDTPDIGALSASPNSRIYRHRFKTLDFGGIAVGNPPIEIIPDLMKNQLEHAPRLGSRLSDNDEPARLSDLIIGMDVLSHLHLYIAYTEGRLYVTPSGAPAETSAQQNTAASH